MKKAEKNKSFSAKTAQERPNPAKDIEREIEVKILKQRLAPGGVRCDYHFYPRCNYFREY